MAFLILQQAFITMIFIIESEPYCEINGNTYAAMNVAIPHRSKNVANTNCDVNNVQDRIILIKASILKYSVS